MQFVAVKEKYDEITKGPVYLCETRCILSRLRAVGLLSLDARNISYLPNLCMGTSGTPLQCVIVDR